MMQYYNHRHGIPQEGIYHSNGKEIGNSFGIMFLRIKPDSILSDIINSLEKLWLVLQNLKNTRDVLSGSDNKKNSSPKMTVLIGYSHTIVTKKIGKFLPEQFLKHARFISPKITGGGPLIHGSNLMYANDINTNHILSDDIVIQFIGNNQFLIYNSFIEIWKKIREINQNNDSLRISGFYTGFKRNDKRSWLGFHDGISNIHPDKRYNAIFLNNNNRSKTESRYINGTYMTFIRFEIDLEKWMDTSENKQMEIIGRDKLSGCPLTGIDKNGNPIKISGCPVKGTREITETPNIKFRDIPSSDRMSRYFVPKYSSDSNLNSSHVANMYNIIREHKKNNPSVGIFRQGFEFFESLNDGINFRVGLNFVSFQNDLELLFDCIKRGFGGPLSSNEMNLKLENFVKIRTAGSFFIPPFNKKEKFPGSDIFSVN